jgi:hypothetical protein
MTEIRRNQIKDGAIDNSKVAAGADIAQSKINNLEEVLAARIDLAGDTLTGPLILPADPTQPLEVATKHYVDSLVGNNNFSVVGSIILTRGFKITWVNNTTIQVARGVSKDPSGANAFILNHSINLTLTTPSPDTFYYIHIIGKTTDLFDVDVIADLSATPSSLPLGYDISKCIGAIRTDGLGNIIHFKIEGQGSYRKFIYSNMINFAPIMPDPVVANTWNSFSVASAVPLELTRNIIINAIYRYNADWLVYFRESGTNAQYGSLAYQGVASNTNGFANMGAVTGEIFTDVNGNLEVKSNTTFSRAYVFYVKGFYFEI